MPRTPTRPARQPPAPIAVTPSDWITTASVGDYYFQPQNIKNTTGFARRVNSNLGQEAEELYLSQAVKVFKFEGAEQLTKSVLAVSGVRVLFQRGANARYGRNFVRMALPANFIEQLVNRFELAGVTFGGDYVKDETLESLGGVHYTVFTADLKGVQSFWATDNSEDQTAFNLKKVLNTQQKDLIASVGFKLFLKYKGDEAGVNRANPPMSIAFEPQFIYATDIADEALTGGEHRMVVAGPVVSQLSHSVLASPRAARILAQMD